MTPPWVGPPNDVMGGIVPIERTLFHDDTLAIALTDALAFPAGVRFHLQIAARRSEEMDEDTWWTRHDLTFRHHYRRSRAKSSLGDELLRFGVRFPDGSKATTVDGRGEVGEWPPPPPKGAILHEDGGGGGSGSERFIHTTRHLWLWPLPPREPFEFAVEWPALEVPLTFTELDGAAIAAAAERARPYWP